MTNAGGWRLGAGVADPFSTAAVGGAYDVVAEDYARQFADDLDRLPLDRRVLEQAEHLAPDEGLVLDLGCGPGSIASRLRQRGLPVVAIDLSAVMLAVARRRDPRLPVVMADVRAVPFASASARLVIAAYVVQHLPRGEIGVALAEMRRLLLADGVLMVVAHLGAGEVVMSEFLGHAVDPVGGVLFDADEFRGVVRGAGFDVVSEQQRGPLPHEFDSQRVYLVARRQG
jgi:ubiquinone/menaquinone biosynthesis C-methylase UbiE